MIIVLKPGTRDGEIEDVCRRIVALGLRAHVSRGEQRTVIGAIGDDRFKTRLQALEALECVESMALDSRKPRLVRCLALQARDVAQWESACLTHRRSAVRNRPSLPRPTSREESPDAGRECPE